MKEAEQQPNAAVVGLDPSATCCGAAALDARGGILGLRAIKPPSKAADVQARIWEIVKGARAFLDEHQPRRVVVETPGNMGIPGQARGVGNLLLYAQAVGAVVCMARHWAEGWAKVGWPAEVHTADVGAWTAHLPPGRKQKDKRAAELLLIDPAYAAWVAGHGDKGMDVADAVQLGRWMMEVGRVRGEG